MIERTEIRRPGVAQEIAHVEQWGSRESQDKDDNREQGGCLLTWNGSIDGKLLYGEYDTSCQKMDHTPDMRGSQRGKFDCE